MRELPLLEADGTVRESAAIVALAYMKYPDDPQSADAMAAALASDAFGRSLSAFSQETWARALEAETSGTVAGALLLRMLSFAIHRPEDRFSLNKAVFLHSREVGTPHRSTILKFWGQHKSVAHFWSAISARHAGGDTPLAGAPAPDARLHVDVEHRRITPLGPRERNPSEAQAIESILTVGQRILVEVERRGLFRDQVDWKPWSLPSAYPRPPGTVEIPEPNPTWVDELRGYKAPKWEK
jgi:hypothetical protein